MVGDRALVAQDRVPAALGTELHRRDPRDVSQRAGLHRGQGDPRLGAVVQRWWGPLSDDGQRLVDVVDVDAARHVGAPDAELARRAQDVAEVIAFATSRPIPVNLADITVSPAPQP